MSSSKLVIAKEFFQKAENQKAKNLLLEITEADTTNAEAFFILANIFHIEGKLGKAIKAFRKVLEIEPKNTDAAISLSVLLNDIGKYESAKELFDQASDRVKKGDTLISDQHIDSKFSAKHFELAEMYASYQRFEEALFEYNKAIKLDTSKLEIRIKIAKIYSKKGYLSKALDELKKLKNEYPDYIPARIALGLLHYGTGKIIEAQAEWQNVLQIDPRNDQAKSYLNLSLSATETNI